MIIEIYCWGWICIFTISFLIFFLSPLTKGGRDFIMESLGKGQNYLVEIILDIERGEPDWVITTKYFLHLVISSLLSLLIAVCWPVLFLVFLAYVISYLLEEYPL